MGHWENDGESNEWYTPKYIFDALGVIFDLDAAAPVDVSRIVVPAVHFISKDSLLVEWSGFTWLNPPFGKRNSKTPWLDKMYDHGNGIVLMPDRSSADWWQMAAKKADCHLQVSGKIAFMKPDGTFGDSPSTGTTLFGYGPQAVAALLNAQKNGLGSVFVKLLDVTN